ncbi:MAG: alginate lyase family protein [Verrucomicrobiae bacterium]|nr:alginate lyase family protein [Verrucomicrobiae bacterium]
MKIFLLTILTGLLLTWEIAAQPFIHPGCLSTSNDIVRMRTKVQANAQPWKASWDRLISNSRAQLSYNPRPQAIICRGGSCAGMGLAENYILMAYDAAAAYQCALRYQISGDTNYANKSIQIMDAWADTCTNITGSTDALLALGGQGYQWACAGELMRDYEPWIKSGGLGRFQNWLLTRFYPGCSGFLKYHNGTCDTHYWANWDLFAMNALIAIGVFCDRRDIYNEAINYFKTGIGNGAANKFIWFVHPGYLGQWQESGRDQGHTVLGPILLGVFCEIAWNQGDDLYGYATNLFLTGAEYVAKYNISPLTNNVPYVTYFNCDYVIQTQISSAARGNIRPGWDLIYNHYVNRRGLSAPFTSLMAAQVRPEGGGGNYGSTSGGYDQLGFTTLTHTLDPIPLSAIPAPNNLRADVYNNSVVLSWWGSARATSYSIKRGTSHNGPFVTIVNNLPDNNLSFTDVGLSHGTTYYYVVSSIVDGVETKDSQPIAVTPNRRLSGTIIGSSGSYKNAGATKEHVFDNCFGTYFDAESANGQWVGLDLGISNIISQIAYCPRAGSGSRMVGGQFQAANVPDFSSGVVTLYTITSAPPDNTLTVQNIYNARAFRYVRYLSPNNGWGNVAEIQFFGAPPASTPPPAPRNLKASAGNWQSSLSWSMTETAMSFNIKRAMKSGGPYTAIATNIVALTFTDIGLTNGETYYYVVSARNEFGESENSVEVSVTPGVPIPRTLIPSGAKWRYFANTNDPGTAWRNNLYNDNNWSEGYARLGYGNDGESTKIQNNGQWTTYFRHQFYISDPAKVISLDGRITRDDAAVVFLNGTEIWRDTNFADGEITYQTPALSSITGSDETNWLSFAVQPSHLITGWNVIAAEVHNSSLTSSDIGFDFELTANVIVPLQPRLQVDFLQGGSVKISWSKDAVFFKLYSTPNIGTQRWSPVTNEIILSNDLWQTIVFPELNCFYCLK